MQPAPHGAPEMTVQVEYVVDDSFFVAGSAFHKDIPGGL
jgi:hypothetical protein